MKLVCISDTTQKGLFTKRTEKLKGLTKGKAYSVMLFSNASGYNTTSTSKEFLVYNDIGQWETYDLSRFKPVEE